MSAMSSAARETRTVGARVTAFIGDLSDVQIIVEPQVVRRRSRDFFWYSPILNEQLRGKSAEVVVSPRSEADVQDVRTAYPDDPRSQRGLESNQHCPSATDLAGAKFQTNPRRMRFGVPRGNSHLETDPLETAFDSGGFLR